MTEPIIIVSGCARCGTTAMLTMLEAGGVPVSGDPVSHEQPESTKLPRHHEWLADCRGKAIKILDPHRHTPPTHYPYRWVFMRRDSRQQALSQIKFLEALFGSQITYTRKLRESIRADNQRLPAWLRERYGKNNVLVVRFEKLISNPLDTALRVCRFLSVGSSEAEVMTNAIHRREPECLSTLWELEAIAGASRD